MLGAKCLPRAGCWYPNFPAVIVLRGEGETAMTDSIGRAWLVGWARRVAAGLATAIACLAACTAAADGGGAPTVREPGALREGGRQRFVVPLREPEALALRVPFAAAP